MPIPPTKPPPWYVRETWPAVVALIVALIGAGGAIYKESTAEKPSPSTFVFLGLALVGALALGILKIAQSVYKDAKEAKKSTPDSLRGCLHVLHASIAGLKGVTDPQAGWLRLTLHRVDGESLEQSVDYVGSEDGGAGRVFKIESGLARSFDRKPDMPFEDWVTWLIDEAGMTRESAEGTRKDRFSFLGVPLKSPGGKDVRAVVYLDAHEPLFFDEATRIAIIHGCAGLAAWIDEHYYAA